VLLTLLPVVVVTVLVDDEDAMRERERESERETQPPKSTVSCEMSELVKRNDFLNQNHSLHLIEHGNETDAFGGHAGLEPNFRCV